MDYSTIITGIRKAIYGREVREYIASGLEYVQGLADDIEQWINEAKDAAERAKQSEENAKESADHAAASAEEAAGSAQEAGTSAEEAGASAEEAAESAGKAKDEADRSTIEADRAKTEADRAAAIVGTDKTLTIDGAAADAQATGVAIADVSARLSMLELKYGTNITANPWSVAFDTLSGVNVTGVWNKNAQRIDF